MNTQPCVYIVDADDAARDGLGMVLERVGQKKIDMLITDINMPEIDGISLIKMVRDNPSYKFMPIIILTTDSQGEKKDEAKAAGATGWIVKPFRPDQLVAAVRKVMA